MNEPKPDFTYRSDGVFVSIFPESPEAIKVWNEEIAPKTDSTGKILAAHWEETRLALKRNGYSVRQAKNPKISDDDLLKLMN
jgi:hypothetical protein